MRGRGGAIAASPIYRKGAAAPLDPLPCIVMHLSMSCPTLPPGARGGGNRGIGRTFDPKVEPQGGAKYI